MKDVLIRLKNLLDSQGETYKKMAERCDYATSTVQNMFLRDSDPRADLLEKIITTYKVNANWLLTGEGEMFQKEHTDVKIVQEQKEGLLIPYLDQTVSAGKGAGLLDCDSGECYICIPETNHPVGLKALRVSGDSMEPTLKNGSIVICNSEGFDGDGIYVIRNSEYTFVKRIIKHPEGYSIVSDNSLYPSYICHQEDMVIVGRVVFAVLKM